MCAGRNFSATATEAVNIAAALERRLETKLLLVHVDQLHTSLVSDPIIIESAALQTPSELNREAQRLRELGTDLEGKLLSGSAFNEFVTAATEGKGRLIIVGAIGHGFARRLLVGRVAERTAEISPCPVVIARLGKRSPDRKHKPPAVLRLMHDGKSSR